MKRGEVIMKNFNTQSCGLFSYGLFFQEGCRGVAGNILIGFREQVQCKKYMMHSGNPGTQVYGRWRSSILLEGLQFNP